MEGGKATAHWSPSGVNQQHGTGRDEGWRGTDGREEASLVLPEQVTYYLWVPGSQEAGRTVERKRAVFKGVSLIQELHSSPLKPKPKPFPNPSPLLLFSTPLLCLFIISNPPLSALGRG